MVLIAFIKLFGGDDLRMCEYSIFTECPLQTLKVQMNVQAKKKVCLGNLSADTVLSAEYSLFKT